MTKLTIEMLKSMFKSASNNLINHSNRIDALNIFPVPDGDTGSNMSSTLKAATSIIDNHAKSDVKQFLRAFSKELLMGARGNSGVILSQIFKGFCEGWSNNKSGEITIKDVLRGFEKANKFARDSVLKPIEGTILTVIRDTYEKLAKDESIKSIEDIFLRATKISRQSCDNTPNLLAVLKEAGVVDSGGEGLVIIFEGFYAALINADIKISTSKILQDKFVSETEIYDGEFGYCTEAIIEIKKLEKFDKQFLTRKLDKLGNSLVLVNDEEILKVHIHTQKPGEILNLLQKYGEFLKIKSENMTLQAVETKKGITNSVEIEKQTGLISADNGGDPKIKKKSAIISCNSGSGIISFMKEYECDFIIESGQSNNPSIQDFITSIKEVNSDNIIILPNNKNIILASQQAAKIVKNKNITVIPTKNEVEGITAILNFSSSLNHEDNVEEIKYSLKNLIVGQITRAVKNSTIEGIKIRENDYLQILNNKIVSKKSTLIKATQNLIDKMVAKASDPEIIVIYYGADTSRGEAEEIQTYIEEKYDLEIEVKNGDQPIFNFLISLE